jgi:hypothetical protein
VGQVADRYCIAAWSFGAGSQQLRLPLPIFQRVYSE